MVDIEYCSMRDNLIFYGIPENTPIPSIHIQKNDSITSGGNTSGDIIDQDDKKSSQIPMKIESETLACEMLVKQFINDVLKINSNNIVFDRVHRLGSEHNSMKPRPIIVKFHYFTDREQICKSLL